MILYTLTTNLTMLTRVKSGRSSCTHSSWTKKSLVGKRNWRWLHNVGEETEQMQLFTQLSFTCFTYCIWLDRNLRVSESEQVQNFVIREKIMSPIRLKCQLLSQGQTKFEIKQICIIFSHLNFFHLYRILISLDENKKIK